MGLGAMGHSLLPILPLSPATRGLEAEPGERLPPCTLIPLCLVEIQVMMGSLVYLQLGLEKSPWSQCEGWIRTEEIRAPFAGCGPSFS